MKCIYSLNLKLLQIKVHNRISLEYLGFIVDDVQILKNIFLTCMDVNSYLFAHLPFKKNTTFFCVSQISCRSVAPDLEQYRWTTWEQQFLTYEKVAIYSAQKLVLHAAMDCLILFSNAFCIHL